MENNIDKLLFEKVFIIKYSSTHSRGMMVVSRYWYLKKIKKFQKAFKDCNIYYMAELILTPDKLKEIENEIERIS